MRLCRARAFIILLWDIRWNLRLFVGSVETLTVAPVLQGMACPSVVVLKTMDR